MRHKVYIEINDNWIGSGIYISTFFVKVKWVCLVFSVENKVYFNNGISTYMSYVNMRC